MRAWFHCFAGIAGDMALGSLLDAGADLDEVRAILGRLPVEGWSLDAEAVTRNGVAATRAVVRGAEDGIVRTFSHISGLLEEARLPTRVLARSMATFGALADVEGRLHRRPPAQVHFHEVGGLDAIVDVVGTCAALEVLGVDRLAAGSVATGTGVVRTAHGLLPNPAPAVVNLLRGIPTHGLDIGVELTTPTGAALVAALCDEYGPLPAMTIATTGFGAGSRELDHLPNLTQVVIGAAADQPAEGGQPMTLLETNLDDATGETLAHAVETLLAAGALDAWITAAVMKKGRPAHVVSVLCDNALAGELVAVLVAETGTLGVRAQRVERWAARRTLAAVDVDGLPIRVKVSPGRVKAEHDDAARIARHTGTPVREVARRAEAAWRERPTDEVSGPRRDDAGVTPWRGSSDLGPPDGDPA